MRVASGAVDDARSGQSNRTFASRRIASLTAVCFILFGCTGDSPQGPAEFDTVFIERYLLAARARLDPDHPGRGTTDYPGNTVADIPKSYAMVLLGEIIRKKIERLLPLPDLAAISGRWLLENADENGDGTAGWGVPIAWDAYGDGTVNPEDTEYTITTAIVVHALLDWMESSPSAPGARILEVVDRALEPYTKIALRTPAGLLPYSLTPADRQYDTFNPAAYLAGQMQRFSRLVKQPDRAAALAGTADATMQALLDHRRSSPETGAWYWHYSVQESTPNDLPHAAYIAEGIRTYIRFGGALSDEFDLEKVMRHLMEFVDEDAEMIRSWPRFASEIELPARSYDLGLAMHLACSEAVLEPMRDPLLAYLPEYVTEDGGYSKYPLGTKGQTPLIVNEYEAYLYRGLASCIEAYAPPESIREEPLEQSPDQLNEDALIRVIAASQDESSESRWITVPFVSPSVDRLRTQWRRQTRSARLSLDGGDWIEMPEPGIPIDAFPLGGETWGVFFRSIPEGRLKLLTVDQATEKILEAREIQHAPDRFSIYRAAVLHNGFLHLVYYDNPSQSNYLVRYRYRDGRIEEDGPAQALPELRDPAGRTYEMIPAVFLIPHGTDLHIIGGTLDATFSEDGVLSERCLEGCLKVIEATAHPSGPVTLCAAHEGSKDNHPYRIVGPAGLELPGVDRERGLPWNLAVDEGRVEIEYANDANSFRDLFVYDLRRGQQNGWLELGINNYEGRIPWSQIYYLNGFLDLLYLSRRDAESYEIFGPILADIRARLDYELEIINDLWASGHFYTKAFTLDRSPALFSVQTARLLLLFERYLREVPNPVALSSYEDVKDAVSSLHGHIEVLEREGESSRRRGPGVTHLRWPKGSKFSFDGVPVPYNHQNEWAYSIFKSVDNESTRETAGEIVRHFIDRITQAGHLPQDGQWDYWWGAAYEGWSREEGVSVNKPEYPGDRIKAWISFRSIDAMAALAAAEALTPEETDRLVYSASNLVRNGLLYPFVSYELMESGVFPSILRRISEGYARVSSPWEIRNAVWAFARLANANWMGGSDPLAGE